LAEADVGKRKQNLAQLHQTVKIEGMYIFTYHTHTHTYTDTHTSHHTYEDGKKEGHFLIIRTHTHTHTEGTSFHPQTTGKAAPTRNLAAYAHSVSKYLYEQGLAKLAR
jgi:hypothetical protein